MTQEQQFKRLFFGLEIQAPWLPHEPKGRHLEESQRHMTLAFLGNVSYPVVEEFLTHFPTPPFHVGFAGYFNECLFLPVRHPNVVAWKGVVMEQREALIAYQQLLTLALQEVHLLPDYLPNREWLPHVTLCRQPFNPREWEKAFHPLPWISSSIHLYESLGHSQYKPIWHYPLIVPFEEISHTADIAFHIRGENLEQIRTHAAIALAFNFPPLLEYFPLWPKCDSLDDVIIQLNDIISRSDGALGCPFKAISFHGDMEKRDQYFQWEMIVDV